jgi:hypothetical protein
MIKEATHHAMDVMAEAGKTEEEMMAKTALQPNAQAAVTTQKYCAAVFGDRRLTELAAELQSQTEAVSAGDLTRGEVMLTAQAHTLDVIFNKLAGMAIDARNLNQTDTYLKLALRAQGQSRTTWEAVSRIQNPAVNYLRQTNIAHNQQINNHAEPLPEPKPPPNELLEVSLHERMDTRAPSTSSRANQDMEALGSVNRTRDPRR